jgi:arsenical pump membrane protein
MVALVTALLNLDTAAVFLTPVLIRVAQRRGLRPAPFLYGSVLMANASSLFLPGSNLTNLLVLSRTHISGAAFLVGMLALSLSATLVTAAGLLLIHRRGLREQVRADSPPVPAGLGLGFWTALLAAVLMLILRQPALPVFALGAALAGWRIFQGRLTAADVGDRIGAPVLLGLFGAAVALGTIARSSGFPGDQLSSAGQPETAAVAALSSILVNNLPAAVLLSARAPAHPQALLLGLGVGPNLAVTGSLSVLLWWRAANATGVRPSLLAYSRQGIPLALAAILFALLLNGLLGSSL